MARSASRRQFLGTAAGTALGLMTAHTPRASAAPDRPNLLLIVSDDHHFRALGTESRGLIHTPNLDRLAAEGTHFTHCYVSNPICTPSRATMLTGQYGFRNGVTFFGHPIHDASPRWPQLLADAEYRQIGYTGKWHNDQRPLHHGFTAMRHTFLGGMHDYDRIPVVQGSDDPRAYVNRNPTEVFTDGALDLLESFRGGPFALQLSFTAPHDPRVAPPAYEAMYPPEAMPLPPNYMAQPRFDPGTLDIRDEKLLERPLDPMEIRRETGRYYAMITHMDAQIGRVLEWLESRGQFDNTLIAFVGDNGLTLGAHGLLGKQTLLDDGVRVPLIVRGPGVARGARCDALVDVMDLMPTLCEAGGAPVPEGVDGRSLWPHLRDAAAPGRDTVFGHYEDLFRSVRTRHYKYIHHLKTVREELFDLGADPYELHDIAGIPAHAETQTNLRNRLTQWRADMGDGA